MQVETFEVTETLTDGKPECDAAAIELIEKLGLKGQQKLLSPDTSTRSPYRRMNQQEQFVYRTLCPKETPINEYEGCSIPLRILQTAAHVKQSTGLNLFVWSTQDTDIKDPVLVGKSGAYGGDLWMLGRWGEVLEPFDTLVKLAAQRYREKCIYALEACRAEIDGLKRQIENMPEHVLTSAGKIGVPSISTYDTPLS